jgi:hypothetical protein
MNEVEHSQEVHDDEDEEPVECPEEELPRSKLPALKFQEVVLGLRVRARVSPAEGQIIPLRRELDSTNYGKSLSSVIQATNLTKFRTVCKTAKNYSGRREVVL